MAEKYALDGRRKIKPDEGEYGKIVSTSHAQEIVCEAQDNLRRDGDRPIRLIICHRFCSYSGVSILVYYCVN
jgi:hypothetical protein